MIKLYFLISNMFSENDFQYLEVFIFVLPIITIFFIPIMGAFLFRKYYKIYKLLFWVTFIPAIILLLNLFYFWYSFNSDNTYLPEGISLSFVANIIYFLALLMPIIAGYWIHLCSKHKYRDYWILGIAISISILGILWLFGIY